MTSLCTPATSAFLGVNESRHWSLRQMVIFSSAYRSSLNCSYRLFIAPISFSSALRSFGFASLFKVGSHRLKIRPHSRDVRLNVFSGVSDDLEEELQGFFDNIKDLIRLGKEEDARDLLRANHEVVMDLIDSGSQGAEEAASLDTIALGYMVIGDIRHVESIMDVLSKVVNGLKDGEPFLDSVLMHMGGLYAKLEKFDLSISSYKRSIRIKEQKFGNNSSFLCILLLGMAEVMVSCQRFAEAIETYGRAIKILELNKNGEGEELIVPLCEMGNLLLREGKTLDAEYAFSRVLDTFVRLYGEEDGRVGMAMCSLAKVKCAKGDVNQAIDLYKNAIQILKDSKHMELEDEVLEKIIIELAELLHAAGRAQEGRGLLEESMLLTEKSKGKGHPSIVPRLVNLASSHSHSKNFAEAERLLRISLEILTKHVPPEDPSVTFPMLQLAATLYSLHCSEEAERFALNALCIREKAFGKESLPVGEALDCLVSIQTKLEKDESKLMELLKRVLKIQETHFGHDSGEVAETLKKMVYFLDKMGGVQQEIYPLKRRLSMLRKKHKQMVVN